MDKVDPELIELLKGFQYKIEAPIGKGGFASCFLVYSEKYEQPFVCKVSENKESYDLELSILKAADHQHIVRCYDYFSNEKYYILILEYCHGGSLEQNVAQFGAYKGERLYKVLNEIIESLMFLHSLHIAHLDIKPSNILLDEYGRAKMTDFGLSNFFKRNQPCEKYYGTKLFMAPEIFTQTPFNPFQADIWALGLTMYFIIVGNHAANSQAELKTYLQSEYFYFPPNTPSFFQKMVYGCLKIKPDQRLNLFQLKDMLVVGYQQILNQSPQQQTSKTLLRNSSKSAVIIKPTASSLNIIKRPKHLNRSQIKIPLVVSTNHFKLTE